ncbi:MAG: type II CAAX endopeptidase family protein [Pseudoclavibacter sp.]|nr:type II CAAX endopeptidase family protein [Pseudoclavibacter sp.]
MSSGGKDTGRVEGELPADPSPRPGLRSTLPPALLVSASAVPLFALESPWGYPLLGLGVLAGLLADRRLGRDLALVALGTGVISLHSMRADLSWGNILVMGAVLTAAVALPYAISRWVFGDHAIRFPLRRGAPWSRLERGWLVAVPLLGWLVLPSYFIGSGAYRNWPAVQGWSEITRLFLGVNAVGVWDELFFICTVFALYRRHFPMRIANPLQAIVFVSFLWELGYREWGPLLTVPFALVQGWIFSRTKSLAYVIAVHLLFDLIVFLVLVHAHHREWLQIFWY